MVHQEQSLLTNLSVAENIAMNAVSAPRTRPPGTALPLEARSTARPRQVARPGRRSTVDPRTIVGDLPFVDRQMVEIARALRVDELAHAAPLLILDEPTSVLERDETEILEREIRALREIGSVIFVSHRLDEVMRICDRVLVMRDGRSSPTGRLADVTEDELFRLMVGRTAQAEHRRSAASRPPGAAPVLEVEG